MGPLFNTARGAATLTTAPPFDFQGERAVPLQGYGYLQAHEEPARPEGGKPR